jgi:UDP-N-acetylglucosamine 2-epimerase
MSNIFFRELEIPEPVHNLSIGSGAHGQQTGEMLAAIEKVLMTEQPDWVLVYGDTNSTLAGALAAAKLHIPVVHVEAGLRSFNRLMPEEVNRVVTDHLSTLLFCPSQVSVDNLTAEGILKGVSIVGDVMADALQFAAAKVFTNSDILNRLDLQPQSYLLATVHRAENTDNSERLNNILYAFEAINEVIVFPVHPRTRKFLQNKGYQPPENVRLIDPVGYFDIIALEKSAMIILTDSGGMQKEAYWLRVPCITLRDETEWVETVEAGWNILTGTDRKKISNAAQNFTPPTDHPFLYGEGHAAEIIINTLLERNLLKHE